MMARQRSPSPSSSSSSSSSSGPRWDAFVRETLMRLAADVRARRLVIRSESDRARVVIEAPGRQGRNIVVPCDDAALILPSKLPERNARGAMSPFVLWPSNVRVPWKAVLRHRRAVARPDGDGWRVSPESIVVLSLRGEEGGNDMHGWYVRCASAPRKLVEVPLDVARKVLGVLIRADRPRLSSSLITMHMDGRLSDELPPGCFAHTAAFRFARYETRLQRACGATRGEGEERKPMPRERETRPARATSEVCVICLETSHAAEARCRVAECNVHVCATCHADSRGLCPVCDRAAINADYPCAACNQLVRLPDYGFPCLACSARSLCRGCYAAFSECASCDVQE